MENDYRACLEEIMDSANTGLDAIKRAPIVDYNSGIRCLRIQDISQKKEFSNWGYCKVENRNYEKFQLKRNDIIIARTGATIGVNRFISNNLTAVYNNGLIRLRINEKVAYPKYVYYCMQTQRYRDFINSICSGTSTQPNMKINAFLEFDIYLPNISTQKRIVKILTALDEKVENNNQINCNLEQQAIAIYQQMFLDNPQSEWSNGVLSDIANITMGQSPSGSSYNEDGIGTIFFQGRAEFGNRFPSVRLYTMEPKRMACKNDVLMSVRAPVGDINIAHEDCCIGRGLGAIQSKYSHQSFVLYTMFSLKKQLDVFNGEGTVFGSINRDSLNSMPIVIPTNDKIDEFESIVAPMDAVIRNNYDEICRLQQMRDILLPKLMSGELDISDINI